MLNFKSYIFIDKTLSILLNSCLIPNYLEIGTDQNILAIRPPTPKIGRARINQSAQNIAPLGRSRKGGLGAKRMIVLR